MKEIVFKIEKPSKENRQNQPYDFYLKHEKTDKFLINQLKKIGFEFNSRKELEDFCKNRCTIISYNSITKEDDFAIDGKIIKNFWRV